VATDQAAGLVCGVEVTTANVHDAAELEAVLPSEPGDVYGDCAFAGRSAERVIRARGGTPQVVHTGTWGGPEALAQLKAHNARAQRIRCRIETVFGTCKRSYGLRRMRWIGLAKAGLQVRLAAIAYTLRRTVTLISAAASGRRTLPAVLPAPPKAAQAPGSQTNPPTHPHHQRGLRRLHLSRAQVS
jgi:IS5 family transposase